ncbi:hypothetical protein KA107_02315 [Candidatus Pacearchaeota archaeon]|nr:hypothetical protein [Candidatus Pacearchaeota archaeon]
MIAAKNVDLAYKGDWCEQTAEFANAIGNIEIRDRNYRRAILAYETGGFLDQALRVAKILGDSEKIKDLEGKLK